VKLIVPVYASALVKLISPWPVISIRPVHCVSQLTFSPSRRKFETSQVCPGGGGGGWVHSFAVQSCIVFGGGLNGTPGMTICDVVCQRLPGRSSATATAARMHIEAAAARRPELERTIRFPFRFSGRLDGVRVVCARGGRTVKRNACGSAAGRHITGPRFGGNASEKRVG
jgi:hypothetical protein